MRSIERTVLLALFLSLLMGPVGAQWFSDSAAEARQVRMLKRVFALPLYQWKEKLREDRDVLEPSFFDNVEKRIQWALEHGHADDAFRFALVGDLALEVVGRPATYRQRLGNEILGEGIVVSPSFPPRPMEAPPGFDLTVPEKEEVRHENSAGWFSENP